MNYYYKADSLYFHMAWWSIKLSNQSCAAMSHFRNFPRLLFPVKLCFYPPLFLMIPAKTSFSFSDNLRSCLASSQFPEAWAHTEMKPVTKGTGYSTGTCDRSFCSFKSRSVSTERDFLSHWLIHICRRLVALSLNSSWWRILLEILLTCESASIREQSKVPITCSRVYELINPSRCPQIPVHP